LKDDPDGLLLKCPDYDQSRLATGGVLSETLWAHRIPKYGTSQQIPYELVHGHEAVLPMEVNLQVLRVARQNDLLAVDYKNLIIEKYMTFQKRD
jgi:hypothetical protein